MEKPLIISTPHKALQHLAKIKSDFEQIKADKLAHEQRKATTPTNLSLVDFMNSKGMPSHFGAREAMAKQFGMNEYHGTTAHNSRLLAILQAKHAQPQPE